MNKLLVAAFAVASLIPTVASAQDTTADGSRKFGIDPYVGLMGGYEGFESNPGGGIPSSVRGDRLKGGLVEGVAGVNIPIGAFFVGAEGHAAKGFTGDIDWEYGVHGRAGVRAGETGLFYGKVGYRWVNFDRYGTDSRDFGRISYGIGGEFGPKAIGLDGLVKKEGVRFRTEITTTGDFNTVRPMFGVIGHF
ncbi:opacity protein [Sphingomonas sp. CFBP 8760]|uniref:opacity protein n=1 Tax=Sphingomonas sp. CFBP 8760 TaxID=2775282 RepID=UPI00177B335B|nr:opacity protein [Sphingomonas sp. CFBP 8760]MBD8546866.1 opacity protein [Sphingomonas sp. CFBP 8760]